jgi:hypothetical protein
MTNNWVSKSGLGYIDQRDWSKYNEELVLHGEFLLDLDWIRKGWSKELIQMNNNKRGAPFQFPESLIKLQAVWANLVDYREVEGITRRVCAVAQIPDFNDYTTINRRVNKLHLDFELPKQKFVSVSTDGTGMKLNNSGEYRQDKYGKKRNKKYVKVILSANPLTKDLLFCDVSFDDEGHSEPQIAQKDMDNLIKKGYTVDKFWGDGAFDVKELFNFLQKNKIESAIKIRSNASNKADGSLRRAREVAEYKFKGYVSWARDKSYGKRWTGTEVQFSAVKVKYHENTRSKKPENIKKEAKRKFWAYKITTAYAKARALSYLCNNVVVNNYIL